MVFYSVQVMRLQTPKLLSNGFNYIQKASITSRMTRGGPLQLQKPFPYETKKFRRIYAAYDKTVCRLSEENAKVIVVDGPIAVGKTAFAKALAEEFDMRYFPQVTLDEHFILPSGYDIRQHDHELPFLMQSYDHKNFCINPTDVRAGLYQLLMLQYKFLQYIDAVCHLLNTGQGVVLERSYFSDIVFVRAMYDNKYISKNILDTYTVMLTNSHTKTVPPHLIIYLDIPVPVVQERIRTRNYSYEQNSKALTVDYLKSLEHYYKNIYLKKAQKTSEILVYNWTDGGDIELIIDDIERLDFNILRKDLRFLYWQIIRRRANTLRIEYTNKKLELLKYMSVPCSMVPELFANEDKYFNALAWLGNKIPECFYDDGYNIHAGDSFFNILFKTNRDNYRSLKRHKIWKYMGAY